MLRVMCECKGQLGILYDWMEEMRDAAFSPRGPGGERDIDVFPKSSNMLEGWFS